MPDAKTQTFAIIGNPVEHSMSPAIHNAAFKEKKLNSVYLAFRTDDVKGAARGMRALGITGYSVTIPHKIEIMKYLDEIAPIAEKIGAVNTVKNIEGKLYGTNTDGKGAYRAILEAKVNLDQGKCVIIGSGGAARAIGFTVADQSYVHEIVILGIDEKADNALANEISQKTEVKCINLNIEQSEKAIENAKILINCSPVGMHPNIDASPVPEKTLFKELCVFDIVYNPLETKLLKTARSKSCKIIHGTEMFLNQAMMQFELWTNITAPEKQMRKVLMEKLKG